MRILKHRLVFHAHPHQPGDFKEAAERQLTRRIPPGHQAIRLACMQICDGRLIGEVQHFRFAALPALRRQRIKVFEVGERGFTGFRIGLNADVAILQHRLEGIAEERQGQTARPVDIEMPGVAAVFAMLDHITPPAIFQRGGHVIRHDIQNQPQSGLFKGFRHAVEPFASADGRIDFIGVGDVIAVGRS